jgi:tRNA(fMet)-specific endonuclease VapC
LRSILLDTSAYSAYRNGNALVLDSLAGVDRVYMSVFVLGELFYGFEGGDRSIESRHELDKFLRKPTVRFVDATRETAEVFGSVKKNLKRKGTPLPINDVWIAAHCIELGTVLVALDRHFLEVPGLRTWPYMEKQ